MKHRSELTPLLHDVQSKCASLQSAAKLLKDCPAEQAQEMLVLMTTEAREILRCLYDLRKMID